MTTFYFNQNSINNLHVNSREISNLKFIFWGVPIFAWHFQQYFRYIVAGSFIGGGNRSTQGKILTCRTSLTNFFT
jgi:hypothetical protein